MTVVQALVLSLLSSLCWRPNLPRKTFEQATMSGEYRPLATTLEKAERHSYESSTTLDGLDDIDSPSRASSNLATCRLLWLVQGTLFLTSLSLLLLASKIRLSTLKHVQQFSAWSPAAPAVEYSSVKYNITTVENRFVGAGPEVDRAWREISYDSK